LDAIRGLKTVSELAKQHKVHPTQVNRWKQQLLDGAESLFQAGSGHHERKDELPTAGYGCVIPAGSVRIGWARLRCVSDREAVEQP
jgi:putative transposase